MKDFAAIFIPLHIPFPAIRDRIGYPAQIHSISGNFSINGNIPFPLFCLNAKRGPFPRIEYDFVSYPFRGNGPLFCVWPFRTRSKYQKSLRLAFNHHALCLTTVVHTEDFATIFIPSLYPYPELGESIPESRLKSLFPLKNRKCAQSAPHETLFYSWIRSKSLQLALTAVSHVLSGAPISSPTLVSLRSPSSVSSLVFDGSASLRHLKPTLNPIRLSRFARPPFE